MCGQRLSTAHTRLTAYGWPGRFVITSASMSLTIVVSSCRMSVGFVSGRFDRRSPRQERRRTKVRVPSGYR